MEMYSGQRGGGGYGLNWIFRSEKLVKGLIGFAEKLASHGELATYAHLDAENIDVRLTCEMRDHPLFLIPREERLNLVEQSLPTTDTSHDDFSPSDYLLQTQLFHKCRRTHTVPMSA